MVNQVNSDDFADMQPSRIDIWRMFDRIAPRYDILNRILSLGQDGYWRRAAAGGLPERNNIKILDVATGTGDLILSLFANNANITSAVGLDMSAKMLAIAEKKIAKRDSANLISFVRGDAAEIPFADESFDAVTIAFGIRNISDINVALKQMHRILKPGGRAVILEFSLPENIVMKNLFLFYLRTFVPAVGAIISGDYEAYRYLDKTVEAFLSREELCLAMRNAGFANVGITPMTFGIACIYRGDKP